MHMSQATGSARPGATALALGPAFALALLAGACFNPPAGAVQFQCDPAGAAACPAGYECRDDGCCHRVGSEGDEDACKLGVGGSATLPGTGGSGTGDASTGGATGTADATTGDTGGSTGPEATGSSGGTGDASTSSGSTSTSTGPQTTG